MYAAVGLFCADSRVCVTLKVVVLRSSAVRPFNYGRSGGMLSLTGCS